MPKSRYLEPLIAEFLEDRMVFIGGPRQVGKTTAIGMFSKDFDQYINLNLEKASDREIFEK